MSQVDPFEQDDLEPERAPVEDGDVTADAEPETVDVIAALPFGAAGANFLRNLTQHGVFVGIVVLIIALIQIFGRR